MRPSQKDNVCVQHKPSLFVFFTKRHRFRYSQKDTVCLEDKKEGVRGGERGWGGGNKRKKLSVVFTELRHY